jgi:hypothetical protein
MPEDRSHTHGEVFLDARGHGRALRLTWHHEADLVVLSLWRESMCAGTFRLAKSDVNEFIDALVDGLREAAPSPVLTGRPSQPSPPAPLPKPRDPRPARPVTPPAIEPDPADWLFGDNPSRATA